MQGHRRTYGLTGGSNEGVYRFFREVRNYAARFPAVN